MANPTRRQALSLAAGSLLATPAIAQTKQAPGVTATEILIGQTMPYSGPASSYAPIGRVEVAYCDFINAQGGINGRKIKLISLDDGYSPPKTVEQTRRLVEAEGVALIFNQLGTPCATATRKYLNAKKVPQIFVASGATQFGDHEAYPWTMGWQVSYQIEGRVYARYVLATKPDAKIGILYQNDDSGKDFAMGFRDGLGERVGQIVASTSYEVTDPTVDSQILQLQSAGADAVFIPSVPKFTGMALRKVRDLNWNPLYIIASVGSSVSSGLAPVGLDKAVGLVTGAYMKDPSDPQWKDTPAYRDWLAFMQKYQPNADLTDINNVYGYSAAQTLMPVLQQCGNDLSRQNIMKQATNLDIQLPMLHDGIRFTTSPTDYYGIKKLRLQRFDGRAWVPFGEPVGA
ncbi:MAG: branched-chain amino acid ABC transporter substrate-binding protein [Rhodospirillales bacterium 69-11]|nr:ABC transporter substrate-binding protein [Rhodospirillales bacterium]MBN8928849.1 ABC transporter substrate-binding protein [Rhodospirillales bacterium]OJW27728.1 MAG: branched-chain amino acid ABC transporter substrate-binding protein [Rhodospirillales bacterium 69-11]